MNVELDQEIRPRLPGSVAQSAQERSKANLAEMNFLMQKKTDDYLFGEGKINVFTDTLNTVAEVVVLDSLMIDIWFWLATKKSAVGLE